MNDCFKNKGCYPNDSKNGLLSTLPFDKVNSGSKRKDVTEKIKILLPSNLQRRIERGPEKV